MVTLTCTALPGRTKGGVSVVPGSIFDFINSSGYRFNDQLNFFKLKNLVHHGNEIKYGEE